MTSTQELIESMKIGVVYLVEMDGLSSKTEVMLIKDEAGMLHCDSLTYGWTMSFPADRFGDEPITLLDYIEAEVCPTPNLLCTCDFVSQLLPYGCKCGGK